MGLWLVAPVVFALQRVALDSVVERLRPSVQGW